MALSPSHSSDKDLGQPERDRASGAVALCRGQGHSVVKGIPLGVASPVKDPPGCDLTCAKGSFLFVMGVGVSPHSLHQHLLRSCQVQGLVPNKTRGPHTEIPLEVSNLAGPGRMNPDNRITPVHRWGS